MKLSKFSSRTPATCGRTLKFASAKSQTQSLRSRNPAVRAELKEEAAFWQVNAALREAEVGNIASARRGVEAALALFPGRDVNVVAALTLARTGDWQRAKALSENLENNYPKNTLLKVFALPTVKAALELDKDNVSQTLLALEITTPFELSIGEVGYLYPVYVRGQAYLRAQSGRAAVAEFQKVLDHRGIMANFVTGALSHLQIGRAYVLTGDTAKARTAYKEFLTLWKDADPDIPILKQAKAEYAKLQ